MFAATGYVMVRFATSRIARAELKSGVPDRGERDQVAEDVHVCFDELDRLKQRMSELEERVDFAERVLAQQREAPRLEPPHE